MGGYRFIYTTSKLEGSFTVVSTIPTKDGYLEYETRKEAIPLVYRDLEAWSFHDTCHRVRTVPRRPKV